ncbi:MAG: TolC family protein, partial [Verrucomicrobiota bacterium]
TTEELQATPPHIPSGMPSEILERRPDIRSAERRVAAAFETVKEYQAAKLPRISLTSGIGTASNSLSGLIDPRNAAISFGANLLAPIFDAGSRQADLDRASAQQKEAYQNYRKVALQAFHEVENSLTSETYLEKEETNLKEAADHYTAARKVAETRYNNGLTDLTSVLVVQRQELQARITLLNVRGNRLQQRVNLHLALGGNFEDNN